MSKIITVIETENLVVDKCYRCLNDGKYMGKFMNNSVGGSSTDPYYRYTFENGNVDHHRKPVFSELDCNDNSNADKICYDPNILEDGKYQCPICLSKEGGSLRIITHKYNCPNNTKKYCGQFGGRKKRKSTKNNRKSTKNNRKSTKNNRKK
jgi:hypothetical protein